MINGKTEGVSRLGADLGLWTPAGFERISLHDNVVKNWTNADVQDCDQFISKCMQELNVPSVSIAIVHKDGEMLYKKTFGVKQVGSEDPVTVGMPFMTILRMVCLVDLKLLTWETPVTKIFSDFSLSSPSLTQCLTIRRNLDFKFKGVTPEDCLAQMKSIQPNWVRSFNTPIAL